MALFLLSNIVGSSIQITTLPLPLLSTLQASGLVFNAILASLLLQEPFTRRTAFGTLLVAAGAVIISLFSAVPEPSHSLDQLLALLVVPTFVIWMTMTILLVIAVLIGCFFLAHVLSVQKRRSARVRLIRGMGYGLVSGVLSAHSLLLAKSAVELLVRTIVDHKNQFRQYQSWLLLLLFLLFALSQLYYLHRGLKLVSTSILYPFVFCVYNIIAILDGLIYFRQTDRLPPLHGGLIALGTVILLSGVLALSWRLNEEDEDEAQESQFHHGKLDLPQTALTPGMGFVDDNENPSVAVLSPVEDEESGDPNECEPLLRRHTMRDSAMVEAQKRRHRRSTILEVEAIWSELHDSADHRGDQEPRLSRAQRRYSGDGTAGSVTPEQIAKDKRLNRSKTAPATQKKRRRKSTLGMWGRAWDSSNESDDRDARKDQRKSWASSIRLDWFRRHLRGQSEGNGSEHEAGDEHHVPTSSREI